MNSLRKVLKYIQERPEQMNVDAVAGVTLAEGNKNVILGFKLNFKIKKKKISAFIQASLQHKNVLFLDSYQKNSLVDILKLAENTRMILLANENFKELETCKKNFFFLLLTNLNIYKS